MQLLVTENSGAMSRVIIMLLRSLAATSRGAHGHDSTVYGTARASPRGFFAHHLAAISAAIVLADSAAIRAQLTRLQGRPPSLGLAA